MKWGFKSFDRYLLGELVKRSILSALVVEIILVAMQAIRLSNIIVGRDLTFMEIFDIFWGLGIGFLPITLPISFLFSALTVFSQLSAQREFLALQVMGHSPLRLARSSIAFGLILTGLCYWVSYQVGPLGCRNFEKSLREAKRQSVVSVLLSGTFNEDFLDMIFFAEHVNQTTGEMSRVFLQDESGFAKKVSISASKGYWSSERGSPAVLRLVDGVMTASVANDPIIQRIRFDEYNYFVDFNKTEDSNRITLTSATLSELLERRREYKEIKKNPRKIILELGRRFYVSLLCFLFAPLAFGVSLDHRRTAKSRALAYGIGITVAYYLLHFWLFTYLGKRHMDWLGSREVLMWLLMAIPSVITLFFGVWSFRRTLRVPSGN